MTSNNFSQIDGILQDILAVRINPISQKINSKPLKYLKPLKCFRAFESWRSLMIIKAFIRRILVNMALCG